MARVGIIRSWGRTGLAAALPAQFGIGLFSPPVDGHGNSVRAIAACEELSARFGLHVMHPPLRTASAVYRAGSARSIQSAAHRTPLEHRLLRRDGAAIVIRRRQGTLGFASAERLTRQIAGNPTPPPPPDR